MALTRRQWVFNAAAGAVGCGRPQRAQDPNSITVLYLDDETPLGPNADEPAQFLMFLPLAVYDANGQVEGRLAERWEHSPDYRTWTIHLRDGIRWHDGAPFTAHDVKFTVDLRCHPDVLHWPPESRKVRVIDDLTYEITCRGNGMRATIWDDWTVYYPKHLLQHLAPKEFYTWDFWKQPIGNGPYRHLRHVPKTMTQLEANPDYYLGKPGIPKLVLKFGQPDRGGAIPELMSGESDAASYVKRTDILKMRQDARFTVYDQLSHDTVGVLYWNHHSPLFAEATVRKALTLAINRREYMQALDIPDATPVIDAPVSRGQLVRREFPVPIPYNPDLANRLLDDAGWWKRNRQGIRERGGRVFEFTMIASSGGTVGGGGDGAVYVAAQLKRVGVVAHVLTLDGAVVNQRLRAGDLEAMLWGTGGFGTDWTDNGSLDLRVLGYSSPRYMDLLNKLPTAYSPAEEERLLRELTQLFQEEVPATFLHPDVRTTIAKSRILGLNNCPYRGDATWCMDQLALEGQG